MSVDFNADGGTTKVEQPTASVESLDVEVVPYFPGALPQPSGYSIPLDPEIENFDAMRIKQQIAAELASEPPAKSSSPNASKSSVGAAVDRALSRFRDKIVAEIERELSNE